MWDVLKFSVNVNGAVIDMTNKWCRISYQYISSSIKDDFVV